MFFKVSWMITDQLQRVKIDDTTFTILNECSNGLNSLNEVGYGILEQKDEGFSQ